jgi:hypothetical protein
MTPNPQSPSTHTSPVADRVTAAGCPRCGSTASQQPLPPAGAQDTPNTECPLPAYQERINPDQLPWEL